MAVLLKDEVQGMGFRELGIGKKVKMYLTLYENRYKSPED
jgi:hypothetical protein